MYLFPFRSQKKKVFALFSLLQKINKNQMMTNYYIIAKKNKRKKELIFYPNKLFSNC